MVLRACDPRTLEVGGGGIGVQGQLRLPSELPGSLDCRQGGGEAGMKPKRNLVGSCQVLEDIDVILKEPG